MRMLWLQYNREVGIGGWVTEATAMKPRLYVDIGKGGRSRSLKVCSHGPRQPDDQLQKEAVSMPDQGFSYPCGYTVVIVVTVINVIVLVIVIISIMVNIVVIVGYFPHHYVYHYSCYLFPTTVIVVTLPIVVMTASIVSFVIVADVYNHCGYI